MSEQGRTRPAEAQSASAVMMIRPVRFMSNPQTAASNVFQDLELAPPLSEAQPQALNEFEGVVAALREAGVRVEVFDDTREPHTPDAIFPNNWISTHADGTVVVYAMMAENRRSERRYDIVNDGLPARGYQVRRVVDFSEYEAQGRFLEGTGALTLDRVNRIAYACVSPRTDSGLARSFGEQLGYDVETFVAVSYGLPVYHTNVLMSVGERFAVVCEEAIADPEDAARVSGKLRDTGHEIVSITRAQMASFAGNVLELENAAGEKLLAMSTQAGHAFTNEQRAMIERYARIVAAPIDVIELSAGGSLRCMLAELHLPRTGSGTSGAGGTGDDE